MKTNNKSIPQSQSTPIDLSILPTNPGCYIYKNSDNKIIYIGKAKNIKKRVSSYFTKNDHDPKTKALIENITSVDIIATKNEIEALILENNLIKKHKPKYNIQLKDSKSYTFIELTKDTFPKYQVYHTVKKDKDKNLFGPFTSGKARDDILQIINRTFRLRTCKTLPKRACLRYSIGSCSAPCIGKITKKDYEEDINSAKEVIKGKIKQVITSIESRMKKASNKLEFERAKDYRDQINSLEYLKQKQNVERKRKFNEDIINYTEKNNKAYILVFNIYKGTLNNKEEYIIENTKDFLESFIKQYYQKKEIPKEIIIPEEIDKTIEEYLSLKRGNKVKIIIPKLGEKKELLDLVKKNIEITFFGDIEKLETLKRVLNLQEVPSVIECFDISHLGGTNIVASMVQYKNAKPDKSNYRRYKIRTVYQNDDFASMREVVKRRYKRILKENGDLPDLIVIDGGKGQLSSGLEVLKEIGIKIPIISLAKEFEEIYMPYSKESIKLAEKNKARLLLQAIRDEAHRFAIKYNRLLRSKENFKKK